MPRKKQPRLTIEDVGLLHVALITCLSKIEHDYVNGAYKDKEGFLERGKRIRVTLNKLEDIRANILAENELHSKRSNSGQQTTG